MFVVDTNLLVYAIDEDSPHHLPCRSAIERWRRDPSAWYLTWSIVYEFLRVITHPKVLRRPLALSAAWGFLEVLMASPGLSVLLPTERHASVASRVLAELPFLGGNLLHDAHVAILMREHGVRRIYTRDADFHRFPFLEAIDPLLPSV